jgi:hypothetical protein
MDVAEKAQERIGGGRKWRCLCDCGNEIVASTFSLTSGQRHSCGCARRRFDELHIGATFESLTIIGDSVKNIHGQYLWLCRCECGKELRVRAGSLLGGSTKSCGCRRLRNRKKHKNWRGYGDISGVIWKRYYAGAKRRGIAWQISIEYGWKLFQDQGGKCALSGEPLSFAGSNSVSESETTASLDRIDSSKGYIEGNLQWVHKDVNIMKMDLSQVEFIDYCVKVALYSGDKADEGD